MQGEGDKNISDALADAQRRIQTVSASEAQDTGKGLDRKELREIARLEKALVNEFQRIAGLVEKGKRGDLDYYRSIGHDVTNSPGLLSLAAHRVAEKKVFGNNRLKPIEDRIKEAAERVERVWTNGLRTLGFAIGLPGFAITGGVVKYLFDHGLSPGREGEDIVALAAGLVALLTGVMSAAKADDVGWSKGLKHERSLQERHEKVRATLDEIIKRHNL